MKKQLILNYSLLCKYSLRTIFLELLITCLFINNTGVNYRFRVILFFDDIIYDSVEGINHVVI